MNKALIKEAEKYISMKPNLTKYDLVAFAEKQIAELEAQLAISEHDREHNDYELTEVYKKVEELEKENAELRKELNYAKSHCLFHSDCPTQKENAELKADNAEWGKASDKWKSLYESTNKQLTNAKEIIREYVNWANWQSGGNCPSFKSIQDKAEAFLKE